MQYLENLAEKTYQKKIVDCSNQEIYYILLNFIKEKSKEKPRITGNKRLYYISAEFLVGKLLSNNLLNLGLFDEVSNYLQTQNKNLAEIEDYEPEPSLGNGGLGRLAACFLDSIATLGLCGDGIGLNYHFGLFKQTFKNNSQQEEINEWIEQQSWLQNTNVHFDVDFGKFAVRSKLYDIDVIGYKNGVNKLHLFDIETVNEKIVSDGINFDKNNIKENLTLFLYPDDSDKEGKLLRVYQQYFMVSNAAQYILMEHQNNGHSLLDLDKYVKIQINDTHPAMIIPELIRLLVKNGIDFKKSVEITTNTCAYTNHTILSEALEKWPRDY